MFSVITVSAEKKRIAYRTFFFRDLTLVFPGFAIGARSNFPEE
jgi:hypothetical protein